MPVRKRLLFAVLLLAALPAAADALVFGPKTYPVSQGKPQSVTETVALAGPCDLIPNAVYTLVVANDGVSSASIKVNGTEVVAESDFNGQVTSIERPVALTASNTVAITMKGGSRAGSLTLSIRRHIDLTEAVFGEKSYTTTGKSDTFRDSFSVTDPSGRFSIGIRNGATAVKDATIRLNGVEVASGQTVPVRTANELLVETKSDGAGASLRVTVLRHVSDSAGPQIVLNGLADGNVVGESPLTVAGVISDASGLAALTVNGAAVAVSGGGAFTTTVGLVEGPNTIVLEAADCEGNVTRHELHVILEVAPKLAVLSPANRSATNVLTVPLSGTVSASGGIAGVTANGEPMTVSGTNWNGSLAFSGADGTRQITVVATDHQGRKTTLVVDILIDRVAPTISSRVLPAANAAGWINTLALVQFSCSDDASGFELCGPDRTVATDGANQQITGTVRDRAGNVAATTVTVSVDGSAPGLTLTPIASAAPTPTVASAFLALRGTASDSVSGVRSVTCNGTPGVLNGTAFDCPVSLQSGINQIEVRVADHAGNESAGATSVTLDVTPPTLYFDPPANSPATVETESAELIGYTSDESGVSSVRVNGQPAVLNKGRFTYPLQLSEGDNSFAVVVTDTLGNARTGNAVLRRVTPVRVEMTSPADLATVSTATVDVTGTATPAGSQVIVNDVAATVSGTTFLARSVPLAQGRTVITATATSPTGIVATANLNIFRDSIRPRVTIYSPAAGAVLRQSPVAVTGMVDDIVVGTINGEQLTVTVNGIAAEVKNRAFLVTGVPLTAGPNTLTVVATDQGGNSVTVTRAVTLDTSASARLALVSGNGQAAAIGAALANPLAVRALDAAGAPVANKPVTFTVIQNNGTLTAGTTTGRALTVNTNAAGEATVRWTLGTRAGAGNNRVSAQSPGFGNVEFQAVARTATAGRIVVDMGNGQFGVAGQRLQRPLIAVVVDAGNNRLAGVPVTFTVTAGGGNIDGATSVVRTTDSDGRAWVVPTLGAEAGADNNAVEARVGGVPRPATFYASGRIAGPPSQTKISGVVLDNSNRPISGVTLRVDETSLSTQSNAQGHFTIAGTPVGYVKLIVDGTTTQRPGTWPTIEYVMHTLPGGDNQIGMPIYLLPIDVQRGLQVDERTGGTLTFPELPGFSLTVAPGSALFPNGSRAGTVSATLVHADKVPMAPGFGQQPRIIVTIQPAGVHFDPPAKITLPNLDSLAPGEVTEIFSFDHDLGQFVSVGTGSVSEDGSTIVSDPGVGIIKGGWHSGGNPNPTGTTSAVNVQLNAPASGTVGSVINVTASGTPAAGGTYFNWQVVSGNASFLNQPACPGQPTCTAQLKANAGGDVEIQVSYMSAGTATAALAPARVTANAVSTTTSQTKKIRVAAIEIQSLIFMMGYSMKVDKLGSANLTPPIHWVKPVLSGETFVQHPVAYVRSTPAGLGTAAQQRKVTVKVQFKIFGTLTSDLTGVTIHGQGGGLTWKKENQVIPAGASSTPWMEIESENALPETTKYYDPLLIAWSYTTPGTTTPIQAGATANPMYLMLKEPLQALYRTPLHLGIEGAELSNEQAVISHAWSRFANPDGFDDLKTWDNRLLYYYRSGFGFMLCTTNPLELLTSATGTGQCGAIARVFRSALEVNGIPSQLKLVTAVDGDYFLVPKWTATNTTYPGQTYPWKVQLNPPISGGYVITMYPPRPGEQYGDLRNDPGIAGQNSETPTEKIFSNHVIVQPGFGPAAYYDPSYGILHGGPAQFESALFGYLRFFGGPGGSPSAEARVRPTGGALNIQFANTN